MEEKITEFDYEKYMNPELIKNLDTKSSEFKAMIKLANYMSKTSEEEHADKQKHFGKLAPILAGLTPKEKRALIHMIKN